MRSYDYMSIPRIAQALPLLVIGVAAQAAKVNVRGGPFQRCGEVEQCCHSESLSQSGRCHSCVAAACG